MSATTVPPRPSPILIRVLTSVCSIAVFAGIIYVFIAAGVAVQNRLDEQHAPVVATEKAKWTFFDPVKIERVKPGPVGITEVTVFYSDGVFQSVTFNVIDKPARVWENVGLYRTPNLAGTTRYTYYLSDDPGDVPWNLLDRPRPDVGEVLLEMPLWLLGAPERMFVALVIITPGIVAFKLARRSRRLNTELETRLVGARR